MRELERILEDFEIAPNIVIGLRDFLNRLTDLEESEYSPNELLRIRAKALLLAESIKDLERHGLLESCVSGKAKDKT